MRRMAGSQSEQQSNMISELFRLYGNLMYDIAFSILNHEQNAEDAVQNTLLKLLENADRFTSLAPKSMRKLVIVMTRNTARDMLRKMRFHISTDMNEEENQIILSLSESDDKIYKSHELLAHFRKLNDAEQQILWLKYWQGLTHRQIAGELGCSEQAAVSRLRRAREHLKAFYPEEGESDE